MSVDFGLLTNISKKNIKINPHNKNAASLKVQYDKSWNIFEEAKKKLEAAAGNSSSGTPEIDISGLQKEMENELEKFEKLQTMLTREADRNSNSNNPDKGNEDEKNKVKGKNLGGLMA